MNINRLQIKLSSNKLHRAEPRCQLRASLPLLFRAIICSTNLGEGLLGWGGSGLPMNTAILRVKRERRSMPSFGHSFIFLPRQMAALWHDCQDLMLLGILEDRFSGLLYLMESTSWLQPHKYRWWGTPATWILWLSAKENQLHLILSSFSNYKDDSFPRRSL